MLLIISPHVWTDPAWVVWHPLLGTWPRSLQENWRDHKELGQVPSAQLASSRKSHYAKTRQLAQRSNPPRYQSPNQLDANSAVQGQMKGRSDLFAALASDELELEELVELDEDDEDSCGFLVNSFLGFSDSRPFSMLMAKIIHMKNRLELWTWKSIGQEMSTWKRVSIYRIYQ